MPIEIHDLVEQTSTTTGTSPYDMTGTVTARRQFSSLTGGAVVPYAAVDDAGGYEFGIGTWTGTPKKLSRTLVLRSSNSNNPVSWSAGTRRVYITTHASLLGMALVRHSLGEGFSSPTETDDETLGYGPGSQWTTSDGKAYVCFDGSTGSAVWGQMAIPVQAVAIDAKRIQLEDAYLDLNYDSKPRSARCYMLGNTVQAWAQGGLVSWGLSTSDATPSYFVSKDSSNSDVVLNVGTNGAYAVDMLVVATKNTSSGDRKIWKVTAGISVVSGTVTVGTVTATKLLETAGATGWAISLVNDSGNVKLQGTGQAATDIHWNAVGIIAEITVF